MMRTSLKRITKVFKYRLPSQLMSLILVVVTIFLISGGIYAISMPSRWTFLIIYRGLYDQTPIESVAIMLTYALGAAGLLLVYYSMKYRYNPGQASLLIKVGVFLLILSFIIIEIALRTKLT
jgi:hypothetical protein